jgi:hypothetical protein
LAGACCNTMLSPNAAPKLSDGSGGGGIGGGGGGAAAARQQAIATAGSTTLGDNATTLGVSHDAGCEPSQAQQLTPSTGLVSCTVVSWQGCSASRGATRLTRCDRNRDA